MRKYDKDAVEECKNLYLMHNGQNLEAIAQAMNKRWAGFSVASVRNWSKKYSWDEAVKARIAADLERAGWSSAQRLYQEIEFVRTAVYKKIEAHGVTDPDFLKTHSQYAALSVQALSRLEAERGQLESFVAFWEWLCSVAGEISPKFSRELITASRDVLARAQTFYAGSTSSQSET